MPQIVLDVSGKTKSALVERMYEYCALSGTDFQRTPEEMTAGLRDLNDAAAELLGDGIDLGFDVPTYGEGLLEEPSGIADADVAALTLMAAQTRIAGVGGQLNPDLRARLTSSLVKLRSRHAATPPTMSTRAQRIPSLGVRHRRQRLTSPTTE